MLFFGEIILIAFKGSRQLFVWFFWVIIYLVVVKLFFEIIGVYELNVRFNKPRVDALFVSVIFLILSGLTIFLVFSQFFVSFVMGLVSRKISLLVLRYYGAFVLLISFIYLLVSLSVFFLYGFNGIRHHGEGIGSFGLLVQLQYFFWGVSVYILLCELIRPTYYSKVKYSYLFFLFATLLSLYSMSAFVCAFLWLMLVMKKDYVLSARLTFRTLVLTSLVIFAALFGMLIVKSGSFTEFINNVSVLNWVWFFQLYVERSSVDFFSLGSALENPFSYDLIAYIKDVFSRRISCFSGVCSDSFMVSLSRYNYLNTVSGEPLPLAGLEPGWFALVLYDQSGLSLLAIFCTLTLVSFLFYRCRKVNLLGCAVLYFLLSSVISAPYKLLLITDMLFIGFIIVIFGAVARKYTHSYK